VGAGASLMRCVRLPCPRCVSPGGSPCADRAGCVVGASLVWWSTLSASVKTERSPAPSSFFLLPLCCCTVVLFLANFLPLYCCSHFYVTSCFRRYDKQRRCTCFGGARRRGLQGGEGAVAVVRRGGEREEDATGMCVAGVL
jgi:hypothetical protein